MPEPYESEPTVPPSSPSVGEEARTRTYAPAARAGSADEHETKVLPGDLEARPSPPPRHAGRYLLVREIGRGGMGVVLEAEDRELGRRLAVKVLLEEHRDNPALVRRFLDEARICGRLEHPGIVPIHELGRLPDQRPFFTMKLVQGQTLAALLQARRDPADDLPRLLAIFEQICLMMAYAHSHRVIHRDLKPANIMVGNFGEVQVMDWGLAKVLNAAPAPPSPEAEAEVALPPDLADEMATSLAGTVMGTPGYMAPEQARGETERIDARCDVFGLGAILCVILTGKPPYEGTTHPEVHRQAVEADLTGAHARLVACSADAELVRLARRCLAAEPEERPGDAGAVARAITNYRASVAQRLRAAELARASAQVKVRAERKARRLTLALAVALIALLVLGGGGWTWRERERNERRQQTARAVEQHLQRALRLREQGRAAAVGDLTALTEAREAAEAAAESLAGAEVDPLLRLRVEELRAELEPEWNDRRMRARLEEIRLNKSELKDNRFDVKGAASEYAAAFRAYGIDVEKLPAERAAAQIRRSAIAAELAAALDDWGESSEDGERQRLLDLARQADADPWRQRLRAALAERDSETLIEAARSREAAELPPATLYLLGKALIEVGAPVAGRRLLRQAQRQYPDDFWLNFQLAFQLANGNPPRPKESIRYYTAALAVRANSAAAHLSLGNAYQMSERLDDAIESYREAIRLQPGFATAHYNLGNVLNRKGQKDEAIAEYTEAIRLKPDYVEAYNNLGSLHADQGELEDACTAFRKALELKADHAHAHLNLARAMLRRQEPEAALPFARKAVELLPRDAASHDILARVLDALDCRAEAIAAYQAALQRDPRLLSAYSNLAMDFLLRRDVGAALAALRDSVRYRPMDARALFQRGTLLMNQGRLDPAIDLLRAATRLDPQRLGPWMNLGAALSDRGHFDEALAADRQVIRLDPKNPAGYLNLGLTYRRRGDAEQAAQAVRMAAKLAPTDPRYPFSLGNILDEAGRLDEAVAAYRESIRLQPDYVMAHNNLGNTLAKQGELDEAIRSYQNALHYKRDHLSAYRNLAAVLHELGRTEEAIAACREAVTLGPNYAEGHYFLGVYLREQGQFAEACAALRRADELGQRMRGWTQPSARELRHCERLRKMAEQMPAYRAGTARAADAAERLNLAFVCLHGHALPAQAARLYREAFAERPPLANDLRKNYRYHAAIAAALASAGRGDDASDLTESERAAWRKQALDWLRADLESWRQRSESSSAVMRGTLKKGLRRWQQESAFAGLRDASLGKLPEAERAGWRQLWQQVNALLTVAGAGQ